LKPDSVRINNLSYFLIDKERNINQGLELVEKALESSPENFDYLHTKGWGLYKQGKYQEAFHLLNKSWNLRMEKTFYDHAARLHLDSAIIAVNKQK
jgi:tetratricopeptide (TPR) repeat protein